MLSFTEYLVENKYKQFITTEMENHYIKRTNEHIRRVQNNAEFLTKFYKLHDDEKFELLNNVKTHDITKYENPEKDLYTLISWKYHLKEDGNIELNVPDEVQIEMTKISEHHIKNNKHHVEYWDESLISGFLDPMDRDNVDDKLIIDGTKMPKIYIIEMVCDWTSLSQELDGNSDSTEWANKNVNKRWKFTDEQVDLIYKLINTLKENHEDLTV